MSLSVDLHLFPDEAQRATLSQAVYEEWYFARRQQIHARKVKAREESRKEEEEKERVNFVPFFLLMTSSNLLCVGGDEGVYRVRYT